MFFFFNDTATTEIYTLSLHDALPISASVPPSSSPPSRPPARRSSRPPPPSPRARPATSGSTGSTSPSRSEEHTSELQSRQYLVCRLLLEKKKRSTQCATCTSLSSFLR